ncbi:hypothetical protein K431DRAFT_305073 [Polychaeton citri CBS 116435]|uniref:TEA domain-containing protein n=1 Tax=Polychaeton citri CBS 116435 TaxID=1314669 RepID=A0A9P4Q515_9PEZI|nr:hypothetical protein K431DRAFT_305073 [Polychaeton citri CBS 116435]
MQPVQPPHVVPSNAPPLHHDGSLQGHSRGLAHQCNYTPSIANQFISSLTGASAYGGYPTAQAGYQHRPQDRAYRPAYRYGYGRSRYGYVSEQEKEAMVVQHATELFNRFQRSDAYKKYRQRQSSKDEKASKEAQKWPDQLEIAFFRALVRWPPMGRSKYLHKDKQRGRNELIADYIKSLTGVERSRKQVSSHIQVLKPFVEQDPMIMRFLSLSKDELNKGSGRHRGAHASSYSELRRTSQYPVNASSDLTQVQLPPIKDIQKVKQRLDAFQPSSFSMFIQRKWRTESDEEHTEREHTYTQNLDQPRNEDIVIHDWESLSQSYPYLAWMHERHWPLDCSVLVAEASIALPPAADCERKPERELGILYNCASTRLPANTPLRCYNHFFRYKKRHSRFSGHTDFLLTQSQDGMLSEVQIKFGSTFWASVLGPLQDMLHHPPDHCPDPRVAISEELENVSVVQEIYLLNGQEQERILVVYWSFRQSTVMTGKTTWSRLILPTSIQQPQTQDQMTASTTDTSHHGSQYYEPPSPKQHRTDSFFDFNAPITGAEVLSSAAHHHISTSGMSQHPSLQSPFQYDSCNSAPALSSATWPTNLSGDGSIPESANTEFPPQSADGSTNTNPFNFSVNYDPTNFNVIDAGLDSSAFNFDTSTPGNPAASFDFGSTAAAANDDQTLQQYSQHWCDAAASYGNAFDAYSAAAATAAVGSGYDSQQQTPHHTLSGTAGSSTGQAGGAYTGAPQPPEPHAQTLPQPQQQGGATVVGPVMTGGVDAAVRNSDGYSHHHHSQGDAGPYEAHFYDSSLGASRQQQQQQRIHIPHHHSRHHPQREQQAYGGAGQGGVALPSVGAMGGTGNGVGLGSDMKEDALATLADASFMARALQHPARGQ